MRLQITLNESNPRDAALIEHLKTFGARSGVAKQLLLKAAELEGAIALMPAKSAVKPMQPEVKKAVKVSPLGMAQ